MSSQASNPDHNFRESLTTFYRTLPVTPVHPVLPFPFLLAVLLCGLPETLVAFWGALCASVRKILPASCLFIIPNTIRRWVVIANSLPSLQGGVGGRPLLRL